MMLHEAVMLEIYRQALNASELASPRCQSRESTASASGNNDVRCPSNESHYSGHEGHTPGQTPTPTTPPVGLPLPATLAPAAAAALLPPQSAAMAAYFNAAAAAAAQQNHLLLTNPLAAAASLVQQATQQQVAHSPNSQQTLTPTPPNANDIVDTSALDFSTKRSRRNSDDEANVSEDDDDVADVDRNDNEADNANDNETEDLNSPLDLSVNNGRKRQSDEEEPVLVANRKLARSNDYKSLPASSTWVPPINPYLAAVAAANMSPKTPVSLDWNAKTKIAPNEATKALEKMTEMTRLGGSAKSDHNETTTRHSTSSSTNSSATTTTTSNGRHSAWQSHWLNKGADAVKDVFKCVWCKQSFATLASLTTHMKETQHCGVNVPPSVSSNSTATNSGGNQTTQSSHHSRHSTTQSSGTTSAQAAALTANNSVTSSGSKSDLNMLIKETMPLPRKLVRGQDVWLGKGAEQTRQILKCMWCGQSFRSLAEMTSHMQETQHYTNIISQEQIISWKSTDEKTSRDNSSSSSNRASANTNANNNAAAITVNNSATSPNANATNANSTVSAVLTCKVCDQAFSTLKELSNHMVKNNHYKEHMIRTAAAAENVPTMIRGRGRQAREKRKKSLPVRKLLEMERAQHDFKAAGLDQALKPLRDFAVSTKLACETCGDKVETANFVDHIRQCIGRSLVLSPGSQNNNNTLKSPFGTTTPQERINSPQTPHSRSDGRKTSDGNCSPLSTTNTRADILCPLPPTESEKTTGGTSVLNALEQLIEKSFDSRPRHSSSYGDSSSAGTPLGSSILKRLGIDDNVDYTKPLMDPQTMQFLRSYSNYPSNRDRSASESSSVSERCSSRLESFTPERCHDLSRQPTPRLTPDKSFFTSKETRDNMYATKIKSEPIDNNDNLQDTDNIPINEIPKKISVKKEFNIPEDHEDLEGQHKIKEHDMRHNSLTPSSRAISPSMSERSVTPKSTCSSSEKKPNLGLTESSSLNALSSMFNNLNNMNTSTISSTALESNNNNNANNLVVKKTNANPLAALQKLCETTDTPAANTRSSSSSSNNNVPTHSTATSSTSNTVGVGAGNGNNNASMLAFSWACNDAIVTADSIIKCSFCDTPFSSKGAYRHHLSKVHFVKEEPQHEMNNMKSPAGLAAFSPKSMTSPKSVASAKSPAAQQRLEATPPSSVATTPTINPYDESPQSKFLKYTELAKQLSSKNA
ncbi:zinc finger domain-containing protein tiptop [Cochliomyia hominivorax]